MASLIIHRGTKEIGGSAIELKSENQRILLDIGKPLVFGGEPFNSRELNATGQELVSKRILPNIKGLYSWDKKGFDAVIVSHAHLDHYGFANFVNPQIPLYVSKGTRKLIEISQRFIGVEKIETKFFEFEMYKTFKIGRFTITPYLMDHSAFDAAAFEICFDGKVVIYTGDFRNHGRKAICFDRFIERATKQADIFLTEGSMLGRVDEEVPTEVALELRIAKEAEAIDGIVLFQCSSQNIDRLVTFYKAAVRSKRLFIVDVYTANVLAELRALGNNLPYPSKEYPNIKVYFPYHLTQKIFKKIGSQYAKAFSDYYISREKIGQKQSEILMIVRPSIQGYLERIPHLNNGLFIYSLWSGYREQESQVRFEKYLNNLTCAKTM